MTLEHLIIQRLEQVEAIMHEHNLWQTAAPDAQAFTSEQPFSSTHFNRWNGYSGC